MSDFDSLQDDSVAQASAQPQTPAQAPLKFDDLQDDTGKHGTAGEMAKTFVEGAARGIAGPLATGYESMLLHNRPEQLARQEANPVTSAAGEMTGLVGGAIAAPEATLGGALAKVGEATKLASATAGLGKIGSAAVGSAIENMVYQGQDEASKLLLKDPGASAETAIASMGLAGLIGGSFGTGFASISPIWHATMGAKTGGILGAITDKLGGVEGAEINPAQDIMAKTGMNIAPEVQALASKNPAVQEMARTLQQTDTNASGIAAQRAYQDMERQAGDHMVTALGRTPDEVANMPDVSEHDAGTRLAKTLAKEYDAGINPLSQGFDEVRSNMQGVELTPSIADKSEDAIANQAKLQTQLDRAVNVARRAQGAGDPGAAIEAAAKVQDIRNAMRAGADAAKSPGTIDSILDKIGQRAADEGWTTSPSSDIMSQINRINKELPLQKNLKNLGQYISQVGDATNKDPLNGPLRRAGAIITGIMRDAEGEVMASRIGSEAGPDAVEHFRALQEGYRVQSALKDGIADRLGMKGTSTSGYGKAILEMASTDAEGLLRKLSGRGDADWLDFVQKHYPESADVLREHHKDSLFEKAVGKAKEGATVNNAELLKRFGNMTPELKNFVASPETQESLKSIGTWLDAVRNPNHNYSNTARVASKLLKGAGSSAMGMAAGLSGHAGLGVLIKTLGDTVGNSTPDAIRLGLLRFLGSGQPIEAGGFKTMVDYIQHTVKGENLLGNAVKNIFKAGTEVIPARLMPTDKDRDKLTKNMSKMQVSPSTALNMTGKTGHYLPDHATALAQTGSNAVLHMTSLRPNTAKTAALDSQRKPSSMEAAKYNRNLDIAQQPLVVFKHIGAGTLTPDDVNTMKTMYPGLYARGVQKLTEQMAGAVVKGAQIPYKTRMGLSLYMGRPVDSTMQPASIQAAQPQQPMNQPATAITPASNPKRSTSKLGETAKMARTMGQSAEQDRSGRE